VQYLNTIIIQYFSIFLLDYFVRPLISQASTAARQQVTIKVRRTFQLDKKDFKKLLQLEIASVSMIGIYLLGPEAATPRPV
jgi:hypothetical protein